MRVLLGAFGDAGHIFPILALGRALHARGHEVTVQSWERWGEHAEREGLSFSPSHEYKRAPGERQLKPYQVVLRAARDTRPLVRSVRPDLVVADILTPSPALAAECEGVPWATLIPHMDPRPVKGFPPYAMGARLPRTQLARRALGGLQSLVDGGLEAGRRDLNGTRQRLGLPDLSYPHGGISHDLCMVGTFPQLEYPRPPGAEQPNTHVVGPLQWEPPSADVALPGGDPSWPLVLVAPSTAQDREHRMLRSALAGLAHEPVRVLATYNGRPPVPAVEVPPNALLVPWLSYSRTMPKCDVVVTHAGHGTVCRALSAGCSVVAVPSVGDMAENAARVDWAGCGVRLPTQLMRPMPVRLAVLRALDEPGLRARALELQAWLAANDPGERAAMLLEELHARKTQR